MLSSRENNANSVQKDFSDLLVSLMCVYYLYLNFVTKDICLSAYVYYIPYIFCKVWAFKGINQMRLYLVNHKADLFPNCSRI